ncbi:MAG TPA: AAA family ATPase [Bryobacteraceae bacterium]|nr:AAA family ATPase [Bryobacteraceae bacterium]
MSQAQKVDVERLLKDKRVKDRKGAQQYRPEVISLPRLMEMNVPKPEMLIEGILPLRGATLLVGMPKSGKTIFAMQAALAVASGSAFLDYYKILKPGPSLLLEQDDPGATASMKDIANRSRVKTAETEFWLVPRVKYSFGPEFLGWLESEIRGRQLKLCVLDSYTALRRARGGGGDIVKEEQEDLNRLNELAMRTDSAILILHHNSKGSAALDWSQQAAGTFAMAAATEAQIFISRFQEMESAAPERLVRARARHGRDVEAVLRFREETLDYEHIFASGAAPLYPLIQQLQVAFEDRHFSPKGFCQETGVSRSTAHRHINLLFRAGVLIRRGYGEYQLEREYQPKNDAGKREGDCQT